jgi:SAM-dependent methyltransferase
MSRRPGPERSFYGLLTRPVQRERLRAARPYLEAASAPFLDVGCGLTDLPGRLTNYTGCDRNPEILERNRRRFPSVRFVEWDVASGDAPAPVRRQGPFRTVLVLALLEHLRDPAEALRRVAVLLAPGGRVVVTTPHPAGRFPMEAGAALGLLSRHASEEHESLLGREGLEAAARDAGLALSVYRRFLLGANQLAVLERKDAAATG